MTSDAARFYTSLPFLLLPQAALAVGPVFAAASLALLTLLAVHSLRRVARWKALVVRARQNDLFASLSAPLAAAADFGLALATVLYLSHDLPLAAEARHAQLLLGLFLVLPLTLIGPKRPLLFLADLFFLTGLATLTLLPLLRDPRPTPRQLATTPIYVDHFAATTTAYAEQLFHELHHLTQHPDPTAAAAAATPALAALDSPGWADAARDLYHRAVEPTSGSARKQVLEAQVSRWFDDAKAMVITRWRAASAWVEDIHLHPQPYIETVALHAALLSSTAQTLLQADARALRSHRSPRTSSARTLILVALAGGLFATALAPSANAATTQHRRLFWAARILIDLALLLALPLKLVSIQKIATYLALPPSRRPHHDRAALCESLVFDEEIHDPNASVLAGLETLFCSNCKKIKNRFTALIRAFLVVVMLLILTETNWDLMFYITLIGGLLFTPLLFIIPQCIPTQIAHTSYTKLCTGLLLDLLSLALACTLICLVFRLLIANF